MCVVNMIHDIKGKENSKLHIYLLKQLNFLDQDFFLIEYLCLPIYNEEYIQWNL